MYSENLVRIHLTDDDEFKINQTIKVIQNLVDFIPDEYVIESDYIGLNKEKIENILETLNFLTDVSHITFIPDDK